VIRRRPTDGLEILIQAIFHLPARSPLPSITTCPRTTCDDQKFAEFVGVSPQTQLKEVLSCEFTNGVFGYQKPDVLKHIFGELDVSSPPLGGDHPLPRHVKPAKATFGRRPMRTACLLC
jgi:hypothetical protein